MKEYKTVHTDFVVRDSVGDAVSRIEVQADELMEYGWQPLGNPQFINDGDIGVDIKMMIVQTMVR